MIAWSSQNTTSSPKCLGMNAPVRYRAHWSKASASSIPDLHPRANPYIRMDGWDEGWKNQRTQGQGD
jgi:hypothetical protein